MTQRVGKSDALQQQQGSPNDTLPLFDENMRQELTAALKHLEETGFWDAESNKPRGNGRMAPIDAGIAEWTELEHPTLMGGELPFRNWQCEALFNQAGASLDTCLAERASYDELREKHAALWLEIQAFLLEDNVVEGERKSLQRKRRIDQSGASIERLRRQAEHQRDLVRKHKEALESEAWSSYKNASLQGGLDRVRCWDPYWKPFNDRAVNGFTCIDETEEYVDHQSGKPSLHDWVNTRTQDITELSFERLRHDKELAKDTAFEQATAIDEMHLAEQSNRAWIEAGFTFEDQFTTARRTAAFLKLVAFTQTGGPLNFAEQMRPIQERFLMNLADAYARLNAAATGLSIIYAYPLPLPKPSEAERNNRSFLDLLVAWVQQTASFLTRFAQRDQGLAVTISIRQALDVPRSKTRDEHWDDLANPDTIVFLFELPDNLFSGAHFVRLRGVSLCLVSKGAQIPQGVFTGRLRPPMRGRIDYFPTGSVNFEMVPLGDGRATLAPANISAPWNQAKGMAMKLGSVELDQKAPYSRTGRILPRHAERDADIVGTTAFANLSPIGAGANEENRVWRVEIGRLSSQGEDFAQVVRDIELDLHIAFQEALG